MRAKDDLLKAAQTGDSRLARSALHRGANPDARSRGRTALLWAIQEGHFSLVKTLVDAGASLERRDDAGFTPLDQAVGEGNIKMVKLLLKAGAKVNGRTTNGSALHTACAYRRAAIAKVLLAHGANPVTLDDEGRTPVALTMKGKRSRADKPLQKLLAQHRVR